MLGLQDKLNTQACKTSNWQYLPHINWRLCILSEIGGEILTEHWDGWAHWRKETVFNPAGMFFDLIDVLHFAMSHYLQTRVLYPTNDALVDWFQIQIPVTDHNIKLSSAITGLGVGDPSAIGYYALLVKTAELLGFSETQIINFYFTKNVVNKFRQDYGYKEGRYTKKWTVAMPDGTFKVMEDSQAMGAEIVAAGPSQDVLSSGDFTFESIEAFRDQIYARCQHLYEQSALNRIALDKLDEKVSGKP
jgi:dimeric dUTPase (all-alpha-NTP-PPase superfamily)